MIEPREPEYWVTTWDKEEWNRSLTATTASGVRWWQQQKLLEENLRSIKCRPPESVNPHVLGVIEFYTSEKEKDMTDKMHEIRARGWFEYPGERRHALKDLHNNHAWEDRAQARLISLVDKLREGMV